MIKVYRDMCENRWTAVFSEGGSEWCIGRVMARSKHEARIKGTILALDYPLDAKLIALVSSKLASKGDPDINECIDYLRIARSNRKFRSEKTQWIPILQQQLTLITDRFIEEKKEELAAAKGDAE